MSIFDQRGQSVNYQYNAGGNINFGTVQNKVDLIQQLEALQAELSRAIQANMLDEEVATDADYKLKKAVQQAKKPEPDKKTIVQYLDDTKDLVKSVAAATGIVKALTEAIEVVQGLL